MATKIKFGIFVDINWSKVFDFMKKSLIFIFCIIGFFPVALIVAFLLGGPIERVTRIETLGHSGPALWLVLLIYGLLLSISGYKIYIKK